MAWLPIGAAASTDPTLGDWAAVAGAVFTAVAAGAAAVAARQGRQQIEAAERPLLDVQVLKDVDTGLLRLAIINSGRGVARGASFAVHALGHATDNVIGDGFMPPGARVHFLTSIGPLPAPPRVMQADLPDLAVMVIYRDAAGFVHYRTHKEIEYVPRTLIRRRPKYPDRVAVFRRLYPHVDVAAAERATHTVLPGPGG
jgi:hypothetical protein